MSLPGAAPRVLAVVSDDIGARLRAILPGCEMRFVRTGRELVQALDEARCDLMIVEVHYDDSAAVAVLGCVLAREETFPVVCVRDVPAGILRHAVLDGLRTALGRMRADDFIDLLAYPDDESGNACVRALLGRLLPARA